MAADEILALPAGRELDALVAEQVMGWRPGETEKDFPPWWYGPGEGCSPQEAIHTSLPGFSTDVAAAWRVVEKAAKAGWWLGLVLSPSDGNRVWAVRSRLGREVTAATAPLVICKAALIDVLYP